MIAGPGRASRWSGNVLWSAGRAVLVDPAAHGGHRESDLASTIVVEDLHVAGMLRNRRLARRRLASALVAGEKKSRGPLPGDPG